MDHNRAVMAWKLDGMDDAAARMAPFASDTSMIGMIQHLTVVEKSWFESIFSGREVDYGFDFDADRDAEWHLTGEETVEGALAGYEAQIAVSNGIVAASDLDAMAEKEIRGDRYSLRWIVVHMIEETARHAGHADILREHLDGTLGYLPDM